MKITAASFLGAATVAAAMCSGTATSRAATYGNAPWCAVSNEGAGNMMWDCEYPTAAACAPVVTMGNRGFCQLNPYYQGSYPAPPSRHRRYRYY